MKKELKRIFVVGCPRSGTTLVQSLLASHPDAISFIESHFFTQLLDGTSRLSRLLGISKQKGSLNLEKFIQYYSQEFTTIPAISSSRSIKKNTELFANLCDIIAENNGKSVWIEKTPLHLHYIKTIKKYVPGAHFVHVYRNGLDNIISLFNVSKYENWEKYRSLDNCIARWRNDIGHSQRCLHKPNNHFVCYDRLIEAPRRIVSKLFDELCLDFKDDIFGRYSDVAKGLIVDGNEPWKSNNKRRSIKKTPAHFDANQVDYIETKIEDVDLSIFEN